MSLQRQAAATGLGLLPYALAAIGLWAVNAGRVQLPATGGGFVLLVMIGLCVVFVGPFAASVFNALNLARAAVYGAIVHALGSIMPAIVAALTNPGAQGAGATFVRFWAAVTLVPLPLAVAGAIMGAMGREKVRPAVRLPPMERRSG